MKLVDNLYAYIWQGSDNNCNSYLFSDVLKDGGHLLVDPGHIVTPFFREAGVERLVKEMASDGIDAGEVGLVVLTHAHPDHSEGAKLFKEQYNAMVALHKADEHMYQGLNGKVDIYLDEGELVLGDRIKLKLDILHSPGHSPGHITVYWPEQKVLIAGDVVFFGSTGRVDLPGGSVTALKQSIERLSQLDIECLLCGHPYGHPGIIKGKRAVEQNFEFIKANILF